MPKIKVVLMLVVLLFCLNIYSQKGLDKLLNVKYKTGYAILNSGDTLNGCFEFNDCEQNYRLLVYVDCSTFKKQAFDPQDVKFFSLDSLYYIPKKLKTGWEFVELIANDSLKLYWHRRFFTTYIDSNVNKEIMFEKPDGKYLIIPNDKNYSFSVRVSDFFSDYSDLSKMIDKGIYTRKDIFKISVEYNNWLTKGKPNK